MDPLEYLERIKLEIGDINYDQIDFYKNARDSFMQNNFSDYPNVQYDQFTVTFNIPTTSKNVPLVYAVLDRLPDELCVIEAGSVRVTIPNEESFYDNIQLIYDLLSIAGSWKSFSFDFNGKDINRTEFGYVTDYLFERCGERTHYYRRSIDQIKKQYLSGKRRQTKNKETDTKVYISKCNPVKAMRSVIDKYINLHAKNMEVCEHRISDHDIVLRIEDSLIVDFRLMPCYWTRLNDENFKPWSNPYIVIHELTHNDIFKFNFAGFRRCFKSDCVGIDFYKFTGQHCYINEIDIYDYVDKALPELKLQKRYEEYSGETYHYLLFKMIGADGNTKYGVGYTKGAIHAFVLKLCKELEEKNSRSLELNGVSCLPFRENRTFIAAFLSWKGEKKRWRLENQFSYYYEDYQIKDESKLVVLTDEILKDAYRGKYDSCEFGVYSKPLNRWKSEELVFNLTKKLYKDYQVVYQYRPYFLQTENGNMSYDVYICGLKVAIEYQGKQHFEPVEYFGGKEHFEKQQERDKLKAELSKENGVRLVYINYWEDITPALIRSRIDGEQT